MLLPFRPAKLLVPAQPRKGDRLPVPASVRDRVILYHLWDATQGGLEHPWSRKDLKSGELTLTVEQSEPVTRLRLDGSVRFVGNTKPECGFEASFAGFLEYDPSRKAIREFSFVAIGETWGGGSGDRRFIRPGKAPLAMSFELASGESTIDRIAPIGYIGNSGTGYKGAYFSAEK